MSAPDRASRPAGQPPTALTIAGSDSSGGAGLQADLKTFLACHVHGMSAVTAVTVQNSLGVSRFYELPAAAVAEQIESVHVDIGVDAAKTGMLATAEIIDAIADTVTRLGITRLLVDPVAASQHGDPLLKPDALESLRRRLIPCALVVTPNVYEIELLTGIAVRSDPTARDAARALIDLGARFAIVKGGHREGPDAIDIVYDGRDFTELSAPRRSTPHTHGTGDSLGAATTAALARGLDVLPAIAAGKAYVTRGVDGAYPLGQGRGPVGHFWRVRDLVDDYLD
jgi:hydroxymethylpyrimidine/phosphomethylpyrimidine kinase